MISFSPFFAILPRCLVTPRRLIFFFLFSAFSKKCSGKRRIEAKFALMMLSSIKTHKTFSYSRNGMDRHRCRRWLDVYAIFKEELQLNGGGKITLHKLQTFLKTKTMILLFNSNYSVDSGEKRVEDFCECFGGFLNCTYFTLLTVAYTTTEWFGATLISFKF